MSSEWPVLALEDCLDALIDYRGKTPTKTDSGVPLVTAKVIKAGRIETPTEFIAEQDFDSWMRRGMPEPGDVVMTTEAPLGEVAQLGRQKIALAQRVITLRGKAGFLDNDYLLYLMMSEEMQDQLKARATGTTVLGIKQSELRKISLKVPPLAIQKAAASMLKALDDRIALLRETNITLEAIAQALFKSWFVDFDPVHANAAFLENGQAPSLPAEIQALFPSRLVESPQGLIPEGWEVGVLGDVAETSRKQVKPEQLSNETLYVGLEHIPRKQLGLDSWGTAKELASAKSTFERNDILFGKLRPYFHKVVIAPFEGVCSTDILACKAKHTSYHQYVAMQLFSDELIAYADRLSNGAKMPRIGWKDLAAYEVVIPPIEIAEKFSAIAEPMIGRILANVEKAQTLANLRDTLLPRLISGQLRLPEAEAALAEVAP